MNCSVFHQETQVSKNQKKTSIVIFITLIMMVLEIIAGLQFGSIALLSDGIHMGTHTFALCITLFAYIFAHKHSQNTKFTFGTGKVGVLGGYTSAITLLLAALFMIVEAISRFINPVSIDFMQSIWVAILGLIINLISAFILKGDHHHSHDHHHDHHEDQNLKAAYLHVIADALTSILAIVALLAGKYLDAIWLDPAVGIVGAFVIIKWGLGLLKSTGAILLDYDSENALHANVLKHLSEHQIKTVIDLHIWRISDHHRAIICTLEKTQEVNHEKVHRLLSDLKQFCHITVEVY